MRKLFGMTGVLATLAMVTLVSGTATAADFIIDDFEDGNLVAEGFGPGVWLGEPGANNLGLGLSYRTRELFQIGFADLEASIAADPSAISTNVFRLGELADPMEGTQPFSSQAPSDRTTNAPNENLQFAGYNLARTSGVFDASSYQYIRFSAWLDGPQPSWSNVTDAGVIVQIADDSVNSSAGPWDSAGTSLTGLQLTSTPDAFIVRINEVTPTTFKVDPILATLVGSQNVDSTRLNNIIIGYRRAGNVTATTNNLGARWFLDDVMFLDEEPLVSSTNPVLSTIDENGGVNSTTFDVVLTSLPTAPVTVTFTSDDASAVTFSPSSWTYLPSGTVFGPTESLWNIPQTITVTSVDDAVVEADPVLSISFPTTTDDLYYDSVVSTPLSLTITNDDFPSNVENWKILND